LRRIRIPLAPIEAQRRIAAILSVYDDLIENNNRRIKLLEEMAQRIYREWFAEFRYPGHGIIPLVDSRFGPIPQGWVPRTILELAGPAKHAVASGPFGSKLGRADYRPSGVPVIRGGNLAVGGGFIDDGFVFVSDTKADDLASCLARPGDVVITQRGTVGQVGLIPMSARYSRYVLSQSQMKITADSRLARASYIYAALRSPEVTDRIQNMAISAGVPHINLTMLRELTLPAPPIKLQEAFGRLVDPLSTFGNCVALINERLRKTRDLLLPRLISGEIHLDELIMEVPGAA
jgi:type I restriction enzyme S subunit